MNFGSNFGTKFSCEKCQVFLCEKCKETRSIREKKLDEKDYQKETQNEFWDTPKVVNRY